MSWDLHRLVATSSQSVGPICTSLSRINGRRSLPGIDRAHGESRDSHGKRPSARRQNHDVTCVLDPRRSHGIRTVLNRRACHIMAGLFFCPGTGSWGVTTTSQSAAHRNAISHENEKTSEDTKTSEICFTAPSATHLGQGARCQARVMLAPFLRLRFPGRAADGRPGSTRWKRRPAVGLPGRQAERPLPA